MDARDVRLAVENAHYEVNKAERLIHKEVENMAQLCVGRLRSAEVSGYVLANLKRELADFNIQTKRWKEDK